jgi:uncharacterized MAPEG superfamily protein
MTTELTVLAFASFLQAVQFMLYSIFANLQVGPKRALGPRDTKIELDGTAGRLQRAMNNHFEGLIYFTIAVVVTVLGDKTTGFSAICAWVYLGARVAYIPCYVFALTPWRSVVWVFGFIATMLMLLSAVLF